MKNPSLQFYPADWQANKNLKRCSFHLRGIWVEVMWLMHDSDEYGILRWTLEDIANAVGCPVSDLQELANKNVMKGCDKDTFFPGYKDTFLQKDRSRKEVELIPPQQGPIWFSSRMVRDAYIRQERGKHGIQSQNNPNVPKKKDAEKDTLSTGEKDTFPISPTSSSTSSTSINNNSSKEELSSQRKKTEKVFEENSQEMILAKKLFDLIKKNNQFAKEPNFQKWASDFDLMLRVDQRPIEVSEFLIEWCQTDNFWKANILSAKTFREQFEKLFIKAKVLWEKAKKEQEKSIIPNFINPYAQK